MSKEMESPATLRPPERALHLRPAPLALVFAGGAVGSVARYGVACLLPTSAGHMPWATLIVNLVGAFVLGCLLETLVLAGPDHGHRRRLRLLLGTGFCGGLTTYSTFALDGRSLFAGGHVGAGVTYLAVTVVGGLVAAAVGVAVAARLVSGADE
ncbi:fluoride efflux transporter CrcB [Tsukamurella sp. 8F]|uniref:fluoride efflux transporter CrcB n=1 Tax=unclassified Tsukamurella TaxID=2633480 RepID=UPI0023B8E2CD|nr:MULTISPECIES: fluoride efflux transporter CrcB [unclassified Tsukamurella]MDF0531774.1 fluoride efflux transporter CrcB [Tsukamurella sp. 8J]MDF0588024.1 fluoride efflux transporter CrcB [Tsukamurella sp. 8F]